GFSNLAATNFPGAGNLSVDPMFVDPFVHDYRLSAGSPAIGAGAGGADMGAPYPVGGIPSQPLRLSALTASTNSILLTWTDDADNEAGVLIQRSLDGASWQPIGSTAANMSSYTDFSVQVNQTYYYRVRATNGAGVSSFSNPARALFTGP